MYLAMTFLRVWIDRVSVAGHILRRPRRTFRTAGHARCVSTTTQRNRSAAGATGVIWQAPPVEWPIFQHLDPAERREVIKVSVRRRFKSGDTIFHHGDIGSSIHLIDKGLVAIRVVDRLGTAITFDVLPPGTSFGEMSLLGEERVRNASAIAIGTVETLTIGRDDWSELQRRHPMITTVLVELLAERVRRVSDQLVDAHTMSADDRVLKELARLVACLGPATSADGAVVIPITQEELASLAGSTRPTANRALRSLAADGAVEIGRGKIIVHDADRLARAARR
jgi:CRP/FNR family transcriptional regulator, cyclic AMP receptor protein